MSEQRQVLPGLYYHLPPTQGKRNPFAVTQEELTALLAAQRSPRRLDGWLLDTFGGFSPLVCRELAFCLTGDLDTDVSELPEAEKITLEMCIRDRYRACPELHPCRTAFPCPRPSWAGRPQRRKSLFFRRCLLRS